MRRTRRNQKRYFESSASEDDVPAKRASISPKLDNNKEKIPKLSDSDSSSESDIENYLQPVDTLDLNSDFFKVQKPVHDFSKIEKNIFSGVTKLSDLDSDVDEEKSNVKAPCKKTKNADISFENAGPSTSHTQNIKSTFHELHEYTRKMEEAKKFVERYKAKKLAEENNEDVLNLLQAGELKTGLEHTITASDLHSSDFESCESEQEGWEEIKTKDDKDKQQKPLVPKDSLQITVHMPAAIKKKKGVDLLAAMKRRLNRRRKENQVLVHKVHLLCWIAHGNFVNSVINDTCTLAMALSLLPSEKCYPPDRTDLGYLEQIVNWFKRTVKNIEKPEPKEVSLLSSLQQQISKREAYNKKMLVYIFVAILRSLGIQCRLVLSFQVEPLRPPASALHSLSTQDGTKPENKKCNKSKNRDITSKELSKINDTKKQNKPREIDVNKDKDKSAQKSQISEPKHQNRQGSLKRLKPESGILKDKTKVSGPSKNTGEKTKKSREKKIETVKTEETNNKQNQTTSKKSGGKGDHCDKKEVKRDNIKNKSEKVNLRSLNTNERASEVHNSKATSKSNKEDQYSLKVNIEKLDIRNHKETHESSKQKTEHEDQRDTKLPPPKRDKRIKSTESDHTGQSSKDKVDTLAVPKRNKRSKSEEVEPNDGSNPRSTRSTSSAPKENKKLIKIKLPTVAKKGNIQQIDGTADSSFDDEWEDIPQFDGADDKKSTKANRKPSLSKLKSPDKNICAVKDHPQRLKTSENKNDSENEFETNPRKLFGQKNDTPVKKKDLKVNLKKLRPTSPNPISKRSVVFAPSPKKQVDVRGDIVDLIKSRIKEQKHVDKRRMVKKRRIDPDSDSDSDYAPEPIKKKHHDSGDEFIPKTKVKKRVQVSGKSVLSDSDGEDSKNKKKKGIDVWVEVFLELEEKWITADVIFGEVHCVEKLYNRATHPVAYVVAWNNNGSIKDVTKRYCHNFNTVTRKQRVDAKWWDETLKPFLGKKTARDKEEDDDLDRQQLDQPLPKSITEYKNHPLYALKRHLLKFEAIYPPDAPTIGFVRGEAVYPRDCVYTCMSRDIWVKQAKVVKPGENPYKIVKARPKYDKLSNQVITDKMLEIFGPWQTEDYVPPTAENGVVPRNAFGNVELFKSCMLPKGTVHLKLPGLNKIAKRMNIDCVPAIVGFDFHGGWSHPTYDGFVVCKEYEDVVIAAWDLEQDEIEKREQEKIDKRVYGNWKKLIKGLLIREKLKARYDFGESSSQGGKEKKKAKGPRFCTKKRRVYSSSESD